jgi:hypothetical protein
LLLQERKPTGNGIGHVGKEHALRGHCTATLNLHPCTVLAELNLFRGDDKVASIE